MPENGVLVGKFLENEVFPKNRKYVTMVNRTTVCEND